MYRDKYLTYGAAQRNPPDIDNPLFWNYFSDVDELMRLNAKILHETSFDDAKTRLEEIGASEVDETFWNGVHANLERLDDIKDWWSVANGPVQPVIEEADYIEQAAASLPPAPWDENTWSEWTSKLKQETGRKGKEEEEGECVDS